MKYKFSSFLAIIALLSVSSCMQDHPNPLDVSKEIKVSACIESTSNSVIKTRASDISWDKGDAIGLFMKTTGTTLSLPALATNAKYVTTEVLYNFSPTESNAIHFPFYNEKVDFIAYYPYKADLVNLIYKIDVSQQSTLSDIDLLYSNNVTAINSSTEDVKLNFKHQLSKIILNITMEAGGPDLTELKAEITDLNTKADFSLVDGNISNETDVANITFNIAGDGTIAQAIVLPKTSLIDKTLNFTLGEFTYSYVFKTTTIKPFENASIYTLNVKLKPGVGASIDETSTSIEPWQDGNSEDIDAVGNSSNNNTDSPPSTTPGEGETDGGDEGDSTIVKGDGTKEKPYTVEEALLKVGETKKWVKGYIVGYYGTSIRRDSFNRGVKDALESNIAIAFLSTEANAEMTFPVNLDKTSAVRAKINLKGNPDNFEKTVFLYGDIQKIQEKPGLINVTEAIIQK